MFALKVARAQTKATTRQMSCICLATTMIAVLALAAAPALAVDSALTGQVSSLEEGTMEGVLVSAIGPKTVRLVTHFDVNREACERAAEVLVAALRAA